DAEHAVIGAGLDPRAFAAVAVVVELDSFIEQADQQRVRAGLLERQAAGVALDRTLRCHVAGAIATGAELSLHPTPGERNDVLVLDAVIGLGAKREELVAVGVEPDDAQKERDRSHALLRMIAQVRRIIGAHIAGLAAGFGWQ